MRTLKGIGTSSVCAALLLLSACATSEETGETEVGGGVATQADIASLRAEIDELRSQIAAVAQSAELAEQRAAAAASAAERAAADARAASERSDAMFRQSLQK